MNAKAIQIIVIAGLIGTAMVAAFNAPAAYAYVVSNHSGTICKNYNASEATQIDYLINGTRSLKSSRTNVICPLVRSTQSNNGARADVEIMHSGAQSTTCTLYSYDFNGKYLGSNSKMVTGSGYQWEMQLVVAKSDVRSDYSVLCSIPGNATGLIMSIDLIEY